MKTKLFIVSLVIMVSGLVTSCEGESPTEADMKNYLAVLTHYYPYSEDETFVFRNKNTGSTWETEAYDYYHTGVYPYTHLSVCDEVGAKCKGDREAFISAWMIEKGAESRNGVSEVSTMISHEGGSNEVHIIWYIRLHLSDSTYYSGQLFQSVSIQKEVLSQLTDVITIPIQYYHKYGEAVDGAREGAYARVEREKGLTEFSVDGQTVWENLIIFQQKSTGL